MRASRRIFDGYAAVFGRICAVATLEADARSRSGQATTERTITMDTTSTSRTTIHRAVAVCALVAGLALTGCQTPGEHVVAPRPHHFPTTPHAPVGIDVHRPADRVAEDIERNQDRMDELAKRFAGVPADRVEEQLAREAAAAKAPH
jgi:hypothetical protein